MEFERSLFRIHEKILSSRRGKSVVKIGIIIMMIFLFYSLSIFIYANKIYINQSNCLKPALKEFRNIYNIKNCIFNFKIQY